MEFQLSYFKSWKMMLWKCCTQYASKVGKLSSGQRTGKGQFSFQSLRKPIPKKGNAKECSNYHTVALISHASKVMLKILQARLQQYMNQELPDVQAGFRKGRGTRDQIANIHWIIKKARKFQKNIYFCFIFVYGVRKCSSFILLQVVDQFSHHHLLKRLSFFHCISLPPLSKIRCP